MANVSGVKGLPTFHDERIMAVRALRMFTQQQCKSNSTFTLETDTYDSSMSKKARSVSEPPTTHSSGSSASKSSNSRYATTKILDDHFSKFRASSKFNKFKKKEKLRKALTVTANRWAEGNAGDASSREEKERWRRQAEEWTEQTLSDHLHDRPARLRDEQLRARLQYRQRTETAWRELNETSLDDSSAKAPTTAAPRSILGDHSGMVQTDNVDFDNQNLIRGPNKPGQRWSGSMGTSNMSVGELSYRARAGLPESLGGYTKDKRGCAPPSPSGVLKSKRAGEKAVKIFEKQYGDDASIPLASESMEDVLDEENVEDDEEKENKFLAARGFVTLDQLSAYPTLSRHLTYSAATAEGYSAEWATEFLKFVEKDRKVILTKEERAALGDDMALLPGSQALSKEAQINRGWLQSFTTGGGDFAAEAHKYSSIMPSKTSYNQLTKMNLPGIDNSETDHTNFDQKVKMKDGRTRRYLTLAAFKSCDEYNMLNGKNSANGYISWDEIESAAFEGEVTDDEVSLWVAQRRRLAEDHVEICLTEEERTVWVRRLRNARSMEEISGCSGIDCSDWCNKHGKSAGRKKGGPKNNWSVDEVEAITAGRTIAHRNTAIKSEPDHVDYGTKEERASAIGSFGRGSCKRDDETSAGWRNTANSTYGPGTTTQTTIPRPCATSKRWGSGNSVMPTPKLVA